MTQLKQAREVFQTVEPNFMTPNVLSYHEAGVYAIELARGIGVDGEPIFGVSVLKRDGSDARDLETKAMSRLMNSEAEARAYIRAIKRRVALSEIRQRSE
ncbi:hypothetical protein SD70_29365 [Gordoniibacillus kamchatkensis]|uniref:Uncharacterized protein n=1 Tax=Gordoniibacillus kamchatkensis TaxID=1590651 RepID=A0ABR5AAG9_9BACL|nr:hypothetical protein [Paenibacillus sp. VKM B-2647]KIL38008.1 hypothetical protein SD70_29365 [Paenibacillus sp. VKM B-2647]